MDEQKPVAERAMNPEMIERDPLCMAMIAAWLNVTVEQLPVAYRVHTCKQSMAAWQRVADAARAMLAEEGVKAGLEAAAADVKTWFPCSSMDDPKSTAGKALYNSIRALSAADIARGIKP